MSQSVSWSFLLPNPPRPPGTRFQIQLPEEITPEDVIAEVGGLLTVHGKMYPVELELRPASVVVTWPSTAGFPLQEGRYMLSVRVLSEGEGGGSTSVSWGDITGDLSAQEDVTAAINDVGSQAAAATTLAEDADAAASQAQTAAEAAQTAAEAAQTAADSKVDSVVAGTGIAVDDTDPNNPVVSTSA